MNNWSCKLLIFFIKLNSFKRETDDYDKYAEHIIVTFKKNKLSKTKVIGTYRLLKQSIAQKNKGFYSSKEYDLSNLLKSNKYNNLLELSRSCINKKFRKKNVLQLMWKKILKNGYCKKITCFN